jgi:hypothetical protein
MLQGIPVAPWCSGRLVPVHQAPTVLHRTVAARLPRPPRMRSAYRAQVHGLLSLHGVVPLILVAPHPGHLLQPSPPAGRQGVVAGRAEPGTMVETSDWTC